jgi:spoIIIJ-associated protein
MSEHDLGAPGTGDPVREAEAAGETVGEAKWTALRELERRFPGLDKSQVEFVVLSEGERGLLGVGFVPARVIARAGGMLPERPPAGVPEPDDGGDTELSDAGSRLKAYLELVRDALAIEASVSIRETVDGLVGTFHGRELGLAIGKRGQTIDAIQQLAAAILFRVDEPRIDVTVDAAGYRDRRRAALESLADRAASRVTATGRSAELEPMSPAERKIVHIRLKERDDVVTESKGVEPNRYVVVLPAP